MSDAPTHAGPNATATAAPPGRWRRLARVPLAENAFFVVVALCGVVLLLAVASVPLTAREQATLAVISAATFLVVNRFPGRGVSVFLVTLSLAVSLRYIVWRVTQTLGFPSFAETILGGILVVAEFYAVTVLVLGYVQTLWPLERKPVPLPDEVAQWPTVDVYVPTYNEPMSVVRATVLGCAAMDWPRDRMRVWLLDDGRREEFRRFAAEARRRLHRAPRQRARQGRQSQPRDGADQRRVHRRLRLRPHPDARLPAGDDGHDGGGAARRAGADAASLLFARSVPAEPRGRHARAAGRQHVLRPGAGRERFLERDLLLRLVRGAAARSARGDRRRRGRDRHRRRAHDAEAAPARLGIGLSAHPARRRARHRAADPAYRPAHALGARHAADLPARQSAVRTGPQPRPAHLLRAGDGAFLLRDPPPRVPDRAAHVSAARPEHHRRLAARDHRLRAAAHLPFRRHQCAAAEELAALVLERDLRDRARAVPGARHHRDAMGAAEGQVQRHRQGRPARERVFRPGRRLSEPVPRLPADGRRHPRPHADRVLQQPGADLPGATAELDLGALQPADRDGGARSRAGDAPDPHPGPGARDGAGGDLPAGRAAGDRQHARPVALRRQRGRRSSRRCRRRHRGADRIRARHRPAAGPGPRGALGPAFDARDVRTGRHRRGDERRRRGVRPRRCLGGLGRLRRRPAAREPVARARLDPRPVPAARSRARHSARGRGRDRRGAGTQGNHGCRGTAAGGRGGAPARLRPAAARRLPGRGAVLPRRRQRHRPPGAQRHPPGAVHDQPEHRAAAAGARRHRGAGRDRCTTCGRAAGRERRPRRPPRPPMPGARGASSIPCASSARSDRSRCAAPASCRACSSASAPTRW